MSHAKIARSGRQWMGRRAAALVVVVLPTAVHAQSADAPSTAAAAAPDGQLGDIVVTAEKRESTAQRTPISLSVVSAAAIKSNGIGDVADVIKILPGVQYGRNFANAIVTIRGVSSRDTDETGDPAVAISLDGFYFQRSLGINDAMFDLERVEALKGPQGTLYGRSATGGAINFITAKPTKDFSGYVDVTGGNYGTINTEGAVNVPLDDRVQARIAFATRNHDGYRNNAPAGNGDDQDSKAVRLEVAFQPTDRLTGLITGEYIKTGGIGASNYGTPLLYDASGNVIHDKPALPEDGRTWAESTPTGATRTRTNFYRWNLQYDFGTMTLTYLGGYRKFKFTTLMNLDGQLNYQSPFGSNAFWSPQRETPETWNHELRLASAKGGFLDWQVGGYYFKETNSLFSNLSYYNNNNVPYAGFSYRYPDIKTQSVAGFGQASAHFTDTLTLSGGVRYSHDTKSRKGYADYAALGLLLTEDQKGSWNKATYHGGLDWQVTPQNLVYAKVDTGYKPGGYTDVKPYGPENITAYEIGTKNRFFGNKLQLNVSAFYYDYKDQQVLQFVGTQTIIQNAGAARYYGVDADGVFLIGRNDRINADVEYLNAEYTSFNIANPYGSGNLNLAGNAPPQAPRWSGNVGYEHDANVSFGTFTARAQTHLQTSSHLQFYNYADDRQPGYSRTDLMLTFTPPGKKWLLQGFVRNLEDRRIITAAQEQSLLQSYIYQFADPRTYGARFQINW